MIELSAANARHLLEEQVTSLEVAVDRADKVLYELQDRLELKVVPRLIACFDVSHTQGSEVVASAVVFENGEPKRSLYRRMRIRGEWSNDGLPLPWPRRWSATYDADWRETSRFQNSFFWTAERVN